MLRLHCLMLLLSGSLTAATLIKDGAAGWTKRPGSG